MIPENLENLKTIYFENFLFILLVNLKISSLYFVPKVHKA